MKTPKYWNPETFQISSYKYKLQERINKTHRTSGSDNTGLCTYSYNELGFRGESIHKEGFKIMSLGCSFVEGVAVNNEDTWPAQISTLIPNGVNLNFGTGGRSNDFITRCLITYCDSIKPNLVLIMYTFPHRRDFYTENGGIEPYIPGKSWGFFSHTEEGKNVQKCKEDIQNDNDDFYNWYKNHLLISYFLKDKKIPFLWNGSFLNTKYEDLYRYDGNYSELKDKGVDGGHPGPIHNKEYASNLYKHISTNFPDFLNKEINKIDRKLL